MSLREMLKRDFGLEFPISGGGGQSRHDPIVVLDADPVKASMTEMRVLKALGTGRKILWTTRGRTPVESEGRWLEQVKIETKELTATAVITQLENYYFDVNMASGAKNASVTAMVFQDEDTGLALPYELGWLHYVGIRNNDPKTPGLEKTISYNNLGTKATIYLYDNSRNEIPLDLDARIVRNEFESAVLDLIAMNPEAVPIGTVSTNEALVRQTFRIAEQLSIVGLTTHRGKFVKIRASLDCDPVLVEAADQSIAVLLNMLGANSVKTIH